MLRDAAGGIVGVNSVYPQDLALMGGAVSGSIEVPAPGRRERGARGHPASFAALERVRAGGTGPVSLCVLVVDPAEMEGRPEALWPETQLMYAGYLDDERQARIRYLEGAAIGPGLPDSPAGGGDTEARTTAGGGVPDRTVDETNEVTPDGVLALWRGEGAIGDAEARSRVREGPVGRDRPVCRAWWGSGDAFISHNPQLMRALCSWPERAVHGERGSGADDARPRTS